MLFLAGGIVHFLGWAASVAITGATDHLDTDDNLALSTIPMAGPMLVVGNAATPPSCMLCEIS